MKRMNPAPYPITFNAAADGFLLDVYSRVVTSVMQQSAHSPNLTPRMTGLNRPKTETGVYVYEIYRMPYIQNDQLRTGDMIVEFDSKPAGTADHLHKFLREEVFGKTVTIGVLREGRKELITVVPEELI